MNKYLFILMLPFIPFIAEAQDHSHHNHEAHAGMMNNSMQKETVDFWTCSMHPQIKLPKAGKCPICSMDLIPVYKEGVGEETSRSDVTLKLSSVAETLARISTRMVVRKPVEKSVRMVGILDYDETRLNHITAWVPGRIDRMFVDYAGIRVNKGDHMVEVYSPELISAQEELIQASRSLKRLGSGSALVRKSTEQALVSAREKLMLLGLTETQVRQIEKSARVKDKVTIYAPASGVVVERNVTEGMYVQTGTRIYSIARLDSLWLHLDAYESDLPWLRYGQDVEFTTKAIPGKVFHGTISFISPVVDRLTRTTKVRVNVDNSEGSLKPGLFVNGLVKANVYGEGKVVDTSLAGKFIGPMHPEIVRDDPGSCPICGMDLVTAESLGYVTSESNNQAPIVIPHTAPLITGKRAVVYVKAPEKSIYELREVVLGPRAGDFYIVESGLKEGELVVTNGAFKIDADLQIKGKGSMMNPEDIRQTDIDSEEKGSHVQHSKKGGLEILPEDLTMIFKEYLTLSEALAEDNLPGATESLTSVSEMLKKMDTHNLQIDVFNQARKQGDLESIRNHFEILSTKLLKELSNYRLPKDLNVFKAYCPMAGSSKKGAFWLQQGKEVRNPYFGASMLSCGEIKGAM